MGRRGLATIAAAAACLTFAPVATADDAPYGLNDAGGFRNVLPAGEAGTDNAVQLAQFQANGQRPAALGRPAAALHRPAATPRRR